MCLVPYQGDPGRREKRHLRKILDYTEILWRSVKREPSPEGDLELHRNLVAKSKERNVTCRRSLVTQDSCGKV